MSNQGVPVQNVINVSVNITPVGAQFANFDTLLMLGASDVIDTLQRFRVYTSINGVAADFGTTTPEYKAAIQFFGQTPQPTLLYIGRWAFTATSGRNSGGPLSINQQALSNWTTITNGGLHITIDGGASTNYTGLNFSGATTLQGVAAIIDTAISGATVTWNPSTENFIIESSSTGTGSTVSYATAPSAGTDISAQLMWTSGPGTLINGIAAETPLAAVTLFDSLTLSWYGLMFADNTDLNDNQRTQVAAYIEAAANPHLYLTRTNNTAALVSGDTTSLGYSLKQLKYNRTGTFWTNDSQTAPAALYGVGFTVDLDAANSEYTLMWKELVGVVPDALTGPQAFALDANNYTYYPLFNNGVGVVKNGIMASGVFFDEMQGIDWQVNRIQTDVFNLMLEVPKIPQTDAGMHQLLTAITGALDAGVSNGLIGPGTWNAGGFGTLKTGDFLASGYYVYAPPLSTQSQNDRAARKSVPIQIAIKLAGAIHNVIIAVNVNA